MARHVFHMGTDIIQCLNRDWHNVNSVSVVVGEECTGHMEGVCTPNSRDEHHPTGWREMMQIL